MHNLITKLFQKRGITDANQLSDDEKKTFDDWQKVLSAEEKISIEKLEEFCKEQIKIIETKWADYNLDQDKKAQFIPYHTVYSTLLRAIKAPKVAREALEKNLIQLLEQ